MDAVEFLKQHQRMCKTGCSNCPLKDKECFSGYISEISKSNYNIIEVVEQWTQAHPQKTMMDDFFKKHPNAPRTEDGAPRNICPSDCGYTNEPESYIVCEHFKDDCLKCWSRPMEY